MQLWHRMAQDARLIFILTLLNLFWFICCVLSLLALYQAPSRLTIYIPPDLSNGALLEKDKIPKSYVAEFAFNIWQFLNDWPQDGEKDYVLNLRRYRFYLEPGFYAELMRQYEHLRERGEITHRIRQVRPYRNLMDESEQVKVLNAYTWEVDLKIELREFVNGISVKTKYLVIPLQVTRADVNRQTNPFGLSLLGFAQKPHVFEPIVEERALHD